MKNVFLFVLCAILLTPVFCEAAQNSTQKLLPSEQHARMANPFYDFNTLHDAEDEVGFKMVLPKKMPKGYEVTAYKALVEGNKMIEVIYEGDSKEIRFRKGMGDNISGDYEQYPEKSTMKINNVTVALSGDKGKIRLATWKFANYSFSINASTYNKQFVNIGGGLSKNEMAELIKAMLKK